MHLKQANIYIVLVTFNVLQTMANQYSLPSFTKAEYSGVGEPHPPKYTRRHETSYLARHLHPWSFPELRQAVLLHGTQHALSSFREKAQFGETSFAHGTGRNFRQAILN